MRLYHDWEFLENGETIKPISVGMVREDGEELYYEFQNAPWSEIFDNTWLRANVVPGLSFSEKTLAHPLEIRDLVENFLFRAHKVDKKLELWGWYSAYDHVCLAQLFGKMINLPNWCPMYTHDLKQEFDRLGNPEYKRQTEGLHNALEDAKFLRSKHLWLENRTWQD